MSLQDIENCGIIGAGGAGFPTHIKLNSKPDIIIVNAAECEPLLHKDMELILHFSDIILNGLRKVLEITGAKRGIFGIKDKHKKEIDLLNSKVRGNISVYPIEDVYPAGDEVILIYMITKRIVQPGTIPVSVGCLVQNVETLLNIGLNKPVIEKYVSIAGAVENPATVKVPIGVTYAEIFSKFKITTGDYVIRSGGLMMGVLEDNLNNVVTKKTGALIVLPSDHQCVTMYKRFSSEHKTDIIAKAGCDQCSFCTELCPRYLLGQPVRPETAMRNRMFSKISDSMVYPGNLSCCECNLCTMYSCPEGLDPRGATVIEKRIAREMGLKLNVNQTEVHPMYDYRKVPTKKLKQRLDILMFKDEGPLQNLDLDIKQVHILLNQHIGTPSEPVVKIGQTVEKYQLIAKTAGKISANVHASIKGVIENISDNYIVIKVL